MKKYIQVYLFNILLFLVVDNIEIVENISFLKLYNFINKNPLLSTIYIIIGQNKNNNNNTFIYYDIFKSFNKKDNLCLKLNDQKNLIKKQKKLIDSLFLMQQKITSIRNIQTIWYII